ncbi:MAG: Rossmann-like and DUF2520 domain-containing protein [Acidobacteriota bacterium]
MHSVTIIGIGRVGSALAMSLPPTKYRIDSLVVRDRLGFASLNPGFGRRAAVVTAEDLSEINSSIIFITTQDREIKGVVQTIGPLIGGECCVFHTSGALSSDILDPLRKRGAWVGSVHPLVSVSGSADKAEPFEGVYFGIEGDPEAVAIANTVALDLGGTPFSIETSRKALYHASAVMACGHLVALLDASFELMANCGPDPTTARELLMPLVESTIANLSRQSPEAALTGPFARVDIETIDRHLDQLESDPDREMLDIYLVLGERSLDLALRQGADQARVAEVRKRLSMAKGLVR